MPRSTRDRPIWALFLALTVAASAAACGSSRDRVTATDPPGADGTDVPITATRLPTLTPPPPVSSGGPTLPPGATPAATAAATAPLEPVTGELRVWTFAQGDEEVPIKAYLAEFAARNPGLQPKLNVIPEDNYTAKVNTSLQAHDPPDIAIIEDMRWAKVGRIVRLNEHLEGWGVPVDDFNQGGMNRMALEADSAKGVYGVGDFLGGYVMVFNKQMFDDAGLPHPAADRSMSYAELDTICRTLAKPAQDPSQAVYGCAVGDNIYSMEGDDVWGPDGRQVIGNADSQAMVDAFNIGTALIRDRMAPSGQVMDAIGGETDLFALGKIAMTGTDFTEVEKYRANGIDFGIIPFYAVEGPEPVLDTFTAPWGTFTESRNPQAALAFLRFLATDAQVMRMQISPDPPLRTSIAEAYRYGDDDPIKQEYLALLGFARPAVFVPNGVEAWDPGEVVRKMTIEDQTDARPILDKMVADTQPELDRVWQDWEQLGQ